MKKFVIKTKYSQGEVIARLGVYSNGLSSLKLYDPNDGEVVMTPSIIISTESFDRRTMELLEEGNIIAIKNYSENEGIEEQLIELGVIHPTPITSVWSGYANINVYQFTDAFVSTPDL